MNTGLLPPGEKPGKFAGQTHFSSVKCTYRHCRIPMPVCAIFLAAVIAVGKPLVVGFFIVSLGTGDPMLESFQPIFRKEN